MAARYKYNSVNYILVKSAKKVDMFVVLCLSHPKILRSQS